MDNQEKLIMYSKEELEYIKKLCERDTAKEVKIININYCDRYYCPTCGKQQKTSYKNRREGCYCERCGQKLAPFV